jgi:dTDP-4-dehydrorhamnose reductase
MKILILGADGMIGHKMAQVFYKLNFDLFLNTRTQSEFLKKKFPNSTIYHFDFLKQNIEELVEKCSPDYIINSAGITKRRGAAGNVETEYINTFLPRKIDVWCKKNKKKQILFSTDCVFSGDKGNYNDFDRSDAIDNYGSSKGKGELNSKSTLTIRSSMIGREIYNKTELLEWVISNKNQTIKGFEGSIYSGVTTLWMSDILVKIIKKYPGLSGIYNISSSPISKFDLITKINLYFKLNLDIVKDTSFSSNKSLNSGRFFAETGFTKPDWDKMLFDLYIDCENNNNLYKLK